MPTEPSRRIFLLVSGRSILPLHARMSTPISIPPLPVIMVVLGVFTNTVVEVLITLGAKVHVLTIREEGTILFAWNRADFKTNPTP